METSSPNDALAKLQMQLVESKSNLEKTKQQAQLYIAKLKENHATEQAKTQSELDSCKASLAKALQDLQAKGNAVLTDGGDCPIETASVNEQLKDEIENLNNQLSAAKEQAKTYVKTLVAKHNAEVEKCKAEHALALEKALGSKSCEAVGEVGWHDSIVSSLQGEVKKLQAELEQAKVGDRSICDASIVSVAEEDVKKLQADLKLIREQSKSYVKQLVSKHKAELDEKKVELTAMQEEVDNLKADAEAHNLAMQAKDQQVEHARAQLQLVHQSKQELAATQQMLEQQQGTILELQKTLTTERASNEQDKQQISALSEKLRLKGEEIEDAKHRSDGAREALRLPLKLLSLLHLF
jgi:DNA repair exonuclease SbcCD ATPase subunit